MKKIASLFLFLSALCGYAQVGNYTFTQTTGVPYAPIGSSEGTQLTPALTAAGTAFAAQNKYYTDPITNQGSTSVSEGTGFSIGFNFVYDGVVYNKFGVCMHGWISLGSSAFTPNVSLRSLNPAFPIQASTSKPTDPIPAPFDTEPRLVSRIAALGTGFLFQANSDPLQTSSDLRYVTQGTAPNRVLVVQWTDWKKSSNGTGDSYSFQIRLHETTNTVDVVYGSMINNPTYPGTCQVGLRGAPYNNITSNNFSNRTATDNWIATASGTAATQTVAISSANVPASGLTFTWTPPACVNPTGLVVNNISTNGATLTWSGGVPAPAGFEYIVSTSSAMPTGSGTSTTDPTATVSSLDSNTLYYVYLHSICVSGYNNPWVLGGTFRTKCNDLTYFYEDFDNYSYADKVMPNCWENTGTTGSAYITMDGTNPKLGSAPNKLFLKADGSIGTIAYAVLPKVSNLQGGTYRLRFTAYASDIERFLEVGYFTNSADPSNFVSLQKLALSSAASISTAPEFIITPGVLPSGVKSLVFRNSGVAVGTTLAYIDNVVWEQTPVCRDITNIGAQRFTANSVDLSWTKGSNETAWQYALGSLVQSDPQVLPAVDFNSPVTTGANVAATVNNLSALASYKIWVRSKCSDGTFGAWIGPVVFSTTCASVSEFTENFDAATVLPSCWSKIGSAGTVAINTTANPASPSAPYVLELASSSPTALAVVSMPPVNNSGDGTHRLRFKLRGSVNEATIDIGYLTNASDPNTFVYLQNFTASSTTAYNEIITSLGSDPKSAYLAFRNPGNINSSVYVDDVIWEQIPVCSDITALSSNEISSTSITLGWTMGGAESKWQYALGSSTVTDPTTLPAVDFITPTTAGFAVTGLVNNLNPSTSYKIWVRSKCTSSFGAWIGPLVFSTTCSPITDFVQGFDTSTNFPSCWGKVGSGGSVYATSLAGAPSSANALYMSSNSVTSPAVVVMQPVSNSGDASHRLKFKFQGSVDGALLEVGYLINALDPTTFVQLQSFSATSKFESKTAELGFEPASEFLAFRNAGNPAAVIYVDDVIWEPIPTTVPAGASGIKAIPNPSCGNFATNISWNHITGADGYKISVGTSSGNSDVVNNQDLGDILSYSFMGNINTTYYFTVKPYNAFGIAKVNTEQTFVTNANSCYCGSTPISTDGAGITNVQIGATNFPNTVKGYYDYGSKPINLGQGAKANLNITLNTGAYSYNTNVWVDFNDNYNFESSELVASGLSSLTMPYILNASFIVPATAKLGTHRMRVVSVRNGQNIADPCYSFISGVTLDFKINIIVPVANDEATGAIVLTPGNSFAADAITGTNVGATGSINETAPGCGGYNGDDVWFSAITPASGNLTFEINGVTGGITNSAAAVYHGLTDNLYLIDCNDSGSTAGGDHAKITLTGKTPGDLFYLRVWENGEDAWGPFKVSAYDSVLGINAFDEINFLYYPNPVNDVLNLSFNQDINNVIVVNLLGQQVISQTLNANQGKIDMSHLSVGTYLVKVTSGDQSKTIKVLKK